MFTKELIISDYLFHKTGSNDWYKITFDGEVKCNVPAPPMKASMSMTCTTSNLIFRSLAPSKISVLRLQRPFGPWVSDMFVFQALNLGGIRFVRFNKTSLKAGKHMEARRELGRHLSKIRMRDGPYHISGVK